MTDPRELAGLLLEKVPEARADFERAIREWQQAVPGDVLTPDQFFGWALVPFVVRQLEALPDTGARAVLERVFGLLEEWMGDENWAVENTIEVSFVETLCSRAPAAAEKALAFAGPRVRKSFLAMER